MFENSPLRFPVQEYDGSSIKLWHVLADFITTFMMLVESYIIWNQKSNKKVQKFTLLCREVFVYSFFMLSLRSIRNSFLSFNHNYTLINVYTVLLVP